MNDDEYTIESGILNVGNGHKIYYQRWGNSNSKPIFYLHGGPGSGTKDKHKTIFDPKKQQVIFHDQRGSGKSTPFASLENNTTQDLVNDIEKLRTKFGFKKIQISGGSWGSALALVYAITNPSNVHKMLLWGVYTGTKSETDYIQQGGLATHFPDSWHQYIEIVPEDRRKNTVDYYIEKMTDKNKQISEDHIRRWIINESAASSIDADVDNTINSSSKLEEGARSLALLEAHYFINDCFLDDMFVLNNAKTIKDLPIVLVQGRYDHVCPPETAYNLQKALGDNCHLHLVPASHAREGALRETVKAYCWSFLD